MNLSTNSKYALVVIIGVIVVSTPIILMMPPADEPPNEVKLTLLVNEGVMIEAKGLRIYIDPLYIPDNYTELPADVILVTHLHSDHYSPQDIEDIITSDTLFVCPANMTDAIDRFDGFGVNPGDSLQVGDINITAFCMYMPDYAENPSFHQRVSNWTSFIIDIDGFRIFHAGDSKYMEELGELTGTVDVAFLPIYFDPGYGPVNESLYPVVEAIELLQPHYTIPCHFNDFTRTLFFSDYSILIEDHSCEILNWAYFTSRVFELG